LLNEDLLNELSSTSITLKFSHKLIAADFDGKALTFQHVGTPEPLKVKYDLCIGADGSYSTVRRQLMRVVRYASSCAGVN
jgi:kynurenine 3-monooxygenase